MPDSVGNTKDGRAKGGIPTSIGTIEPGLHYISLQGASFMVMKFDEVTTRLDEGFGALETGFGANLEIHDKSDLPHPFNRPLKRKIFTTGGNECVSASEEAAWIVSKQVGYIQTLPERKRPELMAYHVGAEDPDTGLASAYVVVDAAFKSPTFENTNIYQGYPESLQDALSNAYLSLITRERTAPYAPSNRRTSPEIEADADLGHAGPSLAQALESVRNCVDKFMNLAGALEIAGLGIEDLKDIAVECRNGDDGRMASLWRGKLDGSCLDPSDDNDPAMVISCCYFAAVNAMSSALALALGPPSPPSS